ncbi:hypothetical protein ACFWCF_01365 [Rhodococcus sp. NPDC060090]|uniref:hypothetical protein n=1 Tax=Rhodococcus sp. NPDC060090 TaxID=3347056 RepID=UPI0036502E75
MTPNDRRGLVEFLAEYTDRLCTAYRADATYLGFIRIAFALYVIFRPFDYSWTSDIPDAFYQPAPGPFSLISEPPAPGFVTAIEVTQIILAVILLVGFRTIEVSVGLSITLILGAGIANSFGKVDHFILFELLPIGMAAAGWGAALSVDSRLRKNRGTNVGRTRGLPILLWGGTVAFALFTAALPKAVSGWLDPDRQATRGFVSRDIEDPSKVGPLTTQVFEIDWHWLWKLLDYATILVEGWLIVLIFFPILFRMGIAIILFFHLGVYLTLGIEFDSYIFVYLPFFSAPLLWIANKVISRAKPGERLRASNRGVDSESLDHHGAVYPT